MDHNVVYVATINNSIYAFDADSGALLWTNNYGPPTPYANLCVDSGYGSSPSAGAGIVGTPTIDPIAASFISLPRPATGVLRLSLCICTP